MSRATRFTCPCPDTDAHCLTFWWRTSAVTVALAWSSVALATGYHGNPRVSTASATAFQCTGASTASATVAAMRRAAAMSMATSVGPAMATHGRTTATATVYYMATSTSNTAAMHGNQRRMLQQFPHSTASAKAIFTGGYLRQITRQTTAFRSDCHGNFRGNCRGNLHGKQ